MTGAVVLISPPPRKRITSRPRDGVIICLLHVALLRLCMGEMSWWLCVLFVARRTFEAVEDPRGVSLRCRTSGVLFSPGGLGIDQW